MDNITISDLSVKQTLEDSDKFVIRDENNVDQAIAGSALSAKFQAKGNYVTPSSLETTLEDYETSTHAGETYATKTDLSNYGKQYCSDANTVEESISNYNFNTLNTPLKQGISAGSDGAIFTSLTEDKNWGTQLCLASGDYVYIRRKGGGVWTNWEQLMTKQSMSYTREINDGFLIDVVVEFGDSNKPALVKYDSVNVPDGFQWGARTVKWCSSNLIFLDMDWIKSDGSLHKSIALYMNGNWIGWKEL